jgi:hypothetical protein
MRIFKSHSQDRKIVFDQIDKAIANLWCTSLYALNCEQDKWRNINVTAIWGSRQKAKLALKKNLALPAPKTNNNQLAVSKVVQREDILDVKPLAVSRGTLQSPNSKEQVSRFENFQLNISAIYYE